VALAELGRIDEARAYASLLYTRFNDDIRAFLTTRWREFRETDYATFVASLAKAGLVLRDGMLVLSSKIGSDASTRTDFFLPRSYGLAGRAPAASAGAADPLSTGRATRSRRAAGRRLNSR